MSGGNSTKPDRIVDAAKNGAASNDVTQREKVILANLFDGLVVTDENGLIETFNRAAELIFGYSAAEVFGKNVKILMPEPYHSEHDGYLDNYKTTGNPKIIGNDRDVKGMRKSGEVFPISLHVSEMFLEGQRKFLGVIRDITERKKSEEELRQSEASLKLAQHIARLGSWSWDIASGALRWTDEIYKLFGHEPGSFEPTYEAFMNAIHPDDREAVQQAVNISLQTKSPYSVEHRLVLSDGKVRMVHEQGEVTVNDKGEPVRMDGTVHDITERKEAERAKSEFISTVSHELRTPLTAIHGSFGLLVGGALGALDE